MQRRRRLLQRQRDGRFEVLVKGGRVLDALVGCNTVAFDKTGTLTTGSLSCTAMRQLQRTVEDAVARSVSRAHQDFSTTGQLEINYPQIAQLWQEGSELRQSLQQQANRYLQQVDPDQPFEPFFASHSDTPGHSWPALELARIIQFAVDGSQHFEQQVLTLLRRFY